MAVAMDVPAAAAEMGSWAACAARVVETPVATELAVEIAAVVVVPAVLAVARPELSAGNKEVSITARTCSQVCWGTMLPLH